MWPWTSVAVFSWLLSFKKGKLFGEGKLIRKDGEIFTGNFKDDYPLGKAVIKNKSGKVIFDGEFIEK